MYFEPRLFALTQGVRLRIAFAAVLGLIAVGAGVSRLAVSGVIIYRVLSGQASFSALAMPLLSIAALILVRSLFQYWQNAVSHHTANVVKIRLREEAYDHALKLGPGFADRNRTGDLVLTLVEGNRATGDLLRTISLPDHRLRNRSHRHLRLHGDARSLHCAHLPRLCTRHSRGARGVPSLESQQQLSTAKVLRRIGFGVSGQRAGAGDAEVVRTEQAAWQGVGAADQQPLPEHDGRRRRKSGDERDIDIYSWPPAPRSLWPSARFASATEIWTFGRC